MRRRVVITGLGAVAPIGIGASAFWHALREGISGVGTITRFDASTYPWRVAAEVDEFDAGTLVGSDLGTGAGRFAQFGVAAARMAYDDAGLDSVRTAARFPVCVASGAGAVPELEDAFQRIMETGMRRRLAMTVVSSMAHSATNHTIVQLGLTGQTMTLSSACASGLDAVQWGGEQIRAGQVAGVVVAASDAPLTPAVVNAWGTLGWLSRWPGPPSQSLRPFDAMSDGSVLGEGAGAFVLEDLDRARARGARIHAEVLGHGSSSEGLDLRSIDPTGASLQSAMRAALRAARLDPTEIDYISAHGGGVPAHDRAETAAYRAVFGRHAYRIPVSSIKSMIGQPFAAAGALQAVAACFTLQEQFIPPTLNHDIPDASCDLDYVPHRGRASRVNRVLIAARAIGPTHSALILGRPPEC